MRPSAPTPEELRLLLQQSGRYGRSGRQVLETCSFVLAADQDWDPEITKEFLASEEIHPKVWDKLLGIARCRHLRGGTRIGCQGTTPPSMPLLACQMRSGSCPSDSECSSTSRPVVRYWTGCEDCE